MTDEQMTSLRTALGQPADMDWDKLFPMVLAKMGSGKQGPITPNDKNKFMSQDSGFDYKVFCAEFEKTLDIDSKLKPLTAEITTLKAQLEVSQKATAANEKNEVIAAACKDGKVITLSAAALESIPVSALKEIVAGLPKAQIATKATMKVLGAKPEKANTMRDTVDAINRQIEGSYPGAVSTSRN